jgi:hypothetical protein
MYKKNLIQAYVLSTDQTCQEIIRKHRVYLGNLIAMLEVKSTTLGIISDMYIQKHVHLFVAYAIWLQRTTRTLEASSAVATEPRTMFSKRDRSFFAIRLLGPWSISQSMLASSGAYASFLRYVLLERFSRFAQHVQVTEV